jgi:hypothetical protein
MKSNIKGYLRVGTNTSNEDQKNKKKERKR